MSPALTKTCKVTESSSGTAVKPVLVSKQHILRPAEMAEPNNQSGFNQVAGKSWFGFFSAEMPQAVSAAEPGQDAVVTR